MTAALLSLSGKKNDLEQHAGMIDMFSYMKGHRYVPAARDNPVDMFRCIESVDVDRHYICG